MYCSTCGVAVAPGLSYCNYCGAKLTGANDDDATKSSEVKPNFLVFAMVAVFVFGLVAIACLMGMMKVILRFDFSQILAFTVLSFLIMLMIEGVCIRLLFHRKRDEEKPGDAVLSKSPATRELDATQPRTLPEPAPSVTEHTTRAFDPVYNERSSR